MPTVSDLSSEFSRVAIQHRGFFNNRLVAEQRLGLFSQSNVGIALGTFPQLCFESLKPDLVVSGIQHELAEAENIFRLPTRTAVVEADSSVRATSRGAGEPRANVDTVHASHERDSGTLRGSLVRRISARLRLRPGRTGPR